MASSPTFTVGTGNLKSRTVELFKAGRPVHHLVGEEIVEYGKEIRLAAEELTKWRKTDGNGRPVRVVNHDRWSGFYLTVPTVPPCADKSTSLSVSLQLALMSKEQIERENAFKDIKLPFDVSEDIIFFFKSIDKRELDDNPRVMTLLRNAVQSNMCSIDYLDDIAKLNNKEAETRGKRLIIFVTATPTLPEEIPELKPEIVPLPDATSLRSVVTSVLEPLVADKGVKPLTDDAIDRIAQALCGFTRKDAEEAVSLVWARLRSFADLDQVVEVIENEKQALISKLPGVTYIPKHHIIDRPLPGYEDFVSWLDESMGISIEDAKEAGITPLKGFVVGGAPGLGKSEICRYAAKRLKRILLIWNIGASKGSLVGASEKNTVQVLQLARALNALVMLDDVDKSGIAKGKDYTGDGGTGSNMMNMLLVEMADAYSPIVWGVTFNRLPDLTEFMRPGRIDRCFLVERPNGTTRLGVLREGAVRAKRTYDDEKMLQLLAHDITEDWTPSEIIHTIVKDEVKRSIKEKTKVLRVGRMIEQARKIKPQMATETFRKDIESMEAACSQFVKVGNLPEEKSADLDPPPSKVKGSSRRAVE